MIAGASIAAAKMFHEARATMPLKVITQPGFAAVAKPPGTLDGALATNSHAVN
jgi:hypothetical protein